MRRISPIMVLLLFAVHLSAQERKELMLVKLFNGEVITYDVQDVESISFATEEYEDDVVPSFPESDGAEKLDPYNPQKTAAALLQSAGIACTDTIGKIIISPAEYQEIKSFTDKLVAGYKTQKDIHDAEEVIDILGIKEERGSDSGREEAFGKVVDMLLQQRQEDKANKDWATSDKIRDELAALGFEIKDGKDGSTWKLNR